jgi:hypothetical protein
MYAPGYAAMLFMRIMQDIKKDLRETIGLFLLAI